MPLEQVRWGERRKEFFRTWIHYEVERALSARSTAEKEWRDFDRQYHAPTEDQKAHFPFEGAHNFTFPLTAMHTDPIMAMYLGNIYQSDNIWTTQALNERWVNTAKPLQDYLTFLDRLLLKMWDVGYRATREMALLGTTVYKTTWLWESKNIRAYDANGNATTQPHVTSRPVVDHVNLADFLVPPEARSEDPDMQAGAQWVGERHRLRLAQLKQMAVGQAPFLPNFDKEATEIVARHFESSQTDAEANNQNLNRVSDETSHLLESKPVEIWEIHARFDTSGNGIEDDVIVFYHHRSKQILRATYNWHPGGRPYDVARYLRTAGFYGMGIGAQTKMFQNTISNVLNFDLDKLLLTHAPMWQAPEGANLLPDEPIFPGKIWFTPPGEDVKRLAFDSPGNFDIMQMMEFLQQTAQQRDGLTDLQLAGLRQLPSRTPATTVNSLMEQSVTRFDMSIKDLRQGALSNVGLKVLQNLQEQTHNFQNNPLFAQYSELAKQVLGEPEGSFAAAALSVPQEAIELGVGVKLTATSGSNNKEIARQSKLMLLQLGSQMGQQFIQLAQLIQQGGAAGAVAQQLFEGGTTLLTQVLSEFDVTNPEEFVPNLQALQGAQATIQQGFGGPAQGVPQPNGAGGAGLFTGL